MTGRLLCPQCGHDQTLHWPNIVDRPATACVRCLDEGIRTTSTAGLGICCMSASAIVRGV